MPIFTLEAPNGKRLTIEAPDEGQALAGAEKWYSESQGAGASATEPKAPAMDAFEAAAQRVRAPIKRGEQEQGTDWAQVADNAVRLLANGATFGLADKFAGGMNALTGSAPSYDEGVKAERAQTQAIRDKAPVLSAATEIAGGLGSGLGLVRNGVTLAGRLGSGLLPRIAGFGAEGAAYGAASGAGNTYSDSASDYAKNAGKGAMTGAAIGGALPVVGSAAGGIYRVADAFLGPRVGTAGRGASALLRSAAQADEAGLRGLPNLGPEGMLPDAGPSMLGLAQGAGTGTGQGRTALVNALRERDAGVGPRLASTLDQNLGPSPTPSRVEANLSGSRADVGRDYETVMQGARAVDNAPLAAQLDAQIVDARGPAQRALRQVREMLDIPGNAGHLDPAPQALLSTRHAIDGMLAAEANPDVIRRLTLARQQINAELERAVPGIRDVDAQMAELHRQSGALQRGTQVFDTGKEAVRPNELAQEIAIGANPQGTMIGPSAAPIRMRQGARAELDRLVGTQSNDLNVLERKLATPRDWNSQKLIELFGQRPAENVMGALRNERQMRQTFQDVVQNSQTAQRQVSARAMEGAQGGNVPSDITATSLGLKAVNALIKALSGASNANTKDQIGQILASRGVDAQRIAQALLNSAQTTSANSRALARLLGNPALLGASAPVSGRR